MTQQIELTLNAEIVSVDGVVNGESYAFTLTGSIDGMGIWTATVTRAYNGVYRVAVTAVNRNGVATKYSTTVYYGLHLITDRTQFDVDRVKLLAKKGFANLTSKERFEWETGLKGAYNYTDLNRVQSAIRFLQERFSDVGYYVSLSDQKTWTLQDAPTLADMTEYLADVRAIRGMLTLLKTTPSVPDTMVGFTYSEANDIEQILLDVDMLLSNTIASFAYSGDIFGGELH